MTSTAIVAARTQEGLDRALGILREHSLPEGTHERLEAIPAPAASTRNPDHLAALQAEMLAAFAELIDEQDYRMSHLEEKVSRLEKTAAALADDVRAAQETAKGGKKKS